MVPCFAPHACAHASCCRGGTAWGGGGVCGCHRHRPQLLPATWAHACTRFLTRGPWGAPRALSRHGPMQISAAVSCRGLWHGCALCHRGGRADCAGKLRELYLDPSPHPVCPARAPPPRQFCVLGVAVSQGDYKRVTSGMDYRGYVALLQRCMLAPRAPCAHEPAA